MVLERLFDLELRLPPAWRPTYHGALFVFGLALGWAGKLFVLGVLLSLLLLAGARTGVVLFLGLLAVAVGAGAAAGTVHGWLHRAERWGQLGTWLRWAVTFFVYLIALVVLAPKGPLSLDPTYVRFAAVIAAGAAGGFILLDDRKASRPSLRRFQRGEQRRRFWASARRAKARLATRLARSAPLT